MSSEINFPSCRRPGVIVLKLGGSVLASDKALPAAVHEIYRHVRRGLRVVAVVSAQNGATDALLARARRVGGDDDLGSPGAGSASDDAIAALLATGETASASLLRLALDRAGIPATTLDARAAGLLTRGPVLDAAPVALDTAAFDAAFAKVPVVVVPGFAGVSGDATGGGRTTLLGRGGSDLAAVHIAIALGAQTLRLVKDVGALFEADPTRAERGNAPCAFEFLSWTEARALGGRVLQDKALDLAERHGLPFEVGGLGRDEVTLVGARPGVRREAGRAPRPPLRIALLGLGVVGLGVWRHLAAHPESFDVIGIAVRDVSKHSRDGVPAHLLTTDVRALLDRPADVVVELIGGTDDAHHAIRHALAAGRNVVTANKAVVATWGRELTRVARRGGGRLLYSAAAGGVAPLIEAAARLAASGAAGRPPVLFQGVINGTCNVVLDRVAAGESFAEAVAAAQRAGFAEADPTLDLDGSDAAQKLALVAGTGFGRYVPWQTIERRGIDTLDVAEVREAAARGDAVRLVASCRTLAGGGLALRVAPQVLPAAHPLAGVRAEQNRGVFVDAEGRTTIVDGKGAGRWPTAEAVFADLLTLAEERERAASRALSVAAR